jgi:hypothetical protein
LSSGDSDFLRKLGYLWLCSGVKRCLQRALSLEKGGKRGRESAIEKADIGLTSVLQVYVLLIIELMSEGWREIPSLEVG